MAKVNGHGKPAPMAAPAPPAVDPAVLNRAFEETRRMGRTDRVFHWDRRQGVKRLDDAGKLVPGAKVILCGNDKTHGPLIINGAGSNLLCGAHKNGAACTYNQPVSL